METVRTKMGIADVNDFQHDWDGSIFRGQSLIQEPFIQLRVLICFGP